MLDAPAFSIVTPTYNRAHLIGRAIQSVLGQTFGDFELIIVDDASTDDTEAVVEAFDDARIVYVRRSANGGNVRARNDGLRRARGRYVTFLDSDDEFLPNFLEEMHGLLASADEDVGFAWVGRYTVVDSEQGERVVGELAWIPHSSGDRYTNFLRSLRGGIGYGLTIRRACLDTVGLFDEKLSAIEDTDYILRLARHHGYHFSTEPLVKVHLHPGPRVTHGTANRARSYEAIVTKHLPNLERHPGLKASLFYKVGNLYYQSGNKARGRRYLAAALRKRPLWLKAWLAMLLYELLGERASLVHYHASRWVKRIQSKCSKRPLT